MSDSESSGESSNNNSHSGDEGSQNDSSETLEEKVAWHQEKAEASDDPNERGAHAYKAEELGSYTTNNKQVLRRKKKHKAAEKKAYSDALGYLEKADNEDNIKLKELYISKAVSYIKSRRNHDTGSDELVDKVNAAKESLIESYKSKAEEQAEEGNYAGAAVIAEIAESIADAFGLPVGEWKECLLAKIEGLPAPEEHYEGMGRLSDERNEEHVENPAEVKVPVKGCMYQDKMLDSFHDPKEKSITSYLNHHNIFGHDTFFPGNGYT